MTARKLNDYSNVIGNNLIKYRKLKKLSQAGLSNRLNLLGILTYKNDISLIEANKRTVRDYELWGFAKVLDISYDDLFYGIEKKLEIDD